MRKLGLLFLLALACRPSIELPPTPSLDGFDRAVREQYITRRTTLEQLLAEGAASEQAAYALAELGHWYGVYGFASEAERFYRQAAALDLEQARWPYFLGHTLFLEDQLEAAGEAFARAAELAPEFLPARLYLAQTELGGGRLETAESLFQQALVQEPGCAFAEAGLGRLALDSRDFARAVEHFERASAAQPGASALLYPLSRGYRGLGDEARAKEILSLLPDENRRLVEVAVADPWLRQLNKARDGVLHHVQLGKKAFRAGRRGEALQHFRRAMAADDENLDARLEMAVTLGELGRTAAAMRELEEARRLFPDNSRVHFFLGTIQLKQRQMGEAEEHFRTSLAADPHNATVYFNLAQVLRFKGRFEAAAESYRKAAELNPRMSRAAFWQAICQLRLGSVLEPVLEPVIEILEAAVLAAPENTDASSLLVRVRAFARRPPSDLTNIEQLQMHDVLSAESVAMALAASGRSRLAVKWQRAALEAVENADNPSCADDLIRRRLKLYSIGRTAAEPWHPSEVICEVPVDPPETESS